MRNHPPQSESPGAATASSARPAGLLSIKALLFDFDGTLTAPGAIDFPAIKSELGCPVDLPILEHIQKMNDPRAEREAMKRLSEFEIEAARQSRPNSGALETVAWLKQRRLAVGILTRNSRASVLRALEHFAPLGPDDFNLIVTREDPPAPKPSGDGLLWAARRFQVTPPEMLMVGDFLFDCQAGKAAGAVTALLDPGGDPRLCDADCDYRIRHLTEIQALLEGVGVTPATDR